MSAVYLFSRPHSCNKKLFYLQDNFIKTVDNLWMESQIKKYPYTAGVFERCEYAK